MGPVHSTSDSRTCRVALITGAVALALAVTCASAQVRPVQMGTSLDANPQVGSGGSNLPITGYVPVNGNDVITGNVTGLKYFHGNIGYSSPYEFQGNLGTSTLNNFARQSSVGSSFQGTNTGQPSTYYLPSRVISTQSGQIAPGLIGNVPSGGFDSTLTGAAAINPTSALRGEASFTPQMAVLPLGATLPARDYSGLGNQPLVGATGSERVSPLFGVRPEQVATIPSATSPQATDRTGNPNETDNTNRAGNKSATPNLNEPLTPKNNQPENNPNELSPLDPFQRGLKPMGMPIQSRLGAQTDIRVTGQPAPVDIAAANEPAPPQPTPVAAGNDPYAQLLARLNNKMEIDPATGKLRPAPENVQSTDPTKPNYRPPGLLVTVTSRDDPRLLQAGRDIKPLDTFAGHQVTPVNQLMKMAEKELQEGHFMEAADTYQRAINLDPDNALAVVGRAHAELAGGMYESAAYDMKFIFTRKPALTAVRYDLSRFLSARRIDYVTKDLARLAPRSTGASFLLSYVYYQTGKTAELKDTLAEWAKRDTRDKWPALLSKAWVDAPVTVTPPTTAPAPPAAKQP